MIVLLTFQLALNSCFLLVFGKLLPGKVKVNEFNLVTLLRNVLNKSFKLFQERCSYACAFDTL